MTKPNSLSGTRDYRGVKTDSDAQELTLTHDLWTGVQAYLALLHFALMRFTDVAFFNKSKADLPTAKKSLVALLRYSLYRGALEPNPQYL